MACTPSRARFSARYYLEQPFLVASDPLDIGRGRELFFSFEMMIDAPRAGRRIFSDIRHGCFCISKFRKTYQGRLNNIHPPLLRLFFASH